MQHRSLLPVAAAILYLAAIICLTSLAKAVAQQPDGKKVAGDETTASHDDSVASSANTALQTNSIAETVLALHATNNAVDGRRDTRVPPATRQLLTRLKHQLRDLISNTLNRQAAQNETPPQIKSHVLAALKQEGAELSEPPFSEYYKAEEDVIVSYGYIPEIDIEQPAHHPELLVVKSTLAINCGGDTSFYLFRRNENQWTMALALEANGYEAVNGAQNGIDYAISPASESGDFFIVTAEVNAWCTSRWQSLRYKVLRIGQSPYEPQVVLSAEHSVFSNYEPAFKLLATATGFRLDFWDVQSLDLGIMDRAHILNYAVTGSRVTRIAPLALRPEDFLDEWINLPWAEAAKWIEAATPEEIQRWHERLQKPDDANYYGTDFSFIQPCGAQKNIWQIGLNIDSKERADRLPAALYFTVAKRRGVFYLRGINDVRPPGCPGEASPYPQ